MSRKVITVLAVIIVAICLMSGGCYSPPVSSNIDALKDLIKLVPENEKIQESKKQQKVELPDPKTAVGETISVKLYFARSGQEGLGVENRSIAKTQGIARKTMEELLKGPQGQEFLAVFPPGTTLRDINITQDGICIVDLSAEVKAIKSKQEEELMVQAISNTLGQFPSVNEVAFMINGQEVQSIMGE
ncbi:MAG: GerMN domain-containing protein [Syntrophomonadaceae bacterium]|nr:GerMN domain-containing protein [Syntrophomonadaceae bacterium]MDD3023760.1 GerMN domain-containing protein [Syntrophomonadaceae bacterium]